MPRDRAIDVDDAAGEDSVASNSEADEADTMRQGRNGSKRVSQQQWWKYYL